VNTPASVQHDHGDDRKVMSGHREALALARERGDRYGLRPVHARTPRGSATPRVRRLDPADA